jgi:hypothetical protein
VNSDLAYDPAIDGREQYLSARLLLREELAPCFRRREWNLKRAGDRLGRLKDALNRLEIARLRMPNDDAHGHSPLSRATAVNAAMLAQGVN